MVEYLTLKCKCGATLVEEPSDEFMMGLDGDYKIEEFQQDFRVTCKDCGDTITYEDLEPRYKAEFDKVVTYFIEYVIEI